MSLVIVLQSETLFASRAELTMSGGQVETEVTLKTGALVVALAPFCSCGFRSLISNGDNGYFSVVLLGGYHGTSNEGTNTVPVSAYGRPLVLMMEKQ